MFQYQNIRGLVPQTVPSKVPTIKDELSESSAISFSLTETWLTKSHLEAELKIEGYTIKRKDRSDRKVKHGRSSGGVAIYLRDDVAIDAEEVFSFSNGVIESIGLNIPSLNLILIVTYRSPDQADITKDGTVIKKRHRSTAKEFKCYLVQLKKFLKSLSSPTPDIIMKGDYNLPHADWVTGECKAGATSDEQEMVRALYELALEHFLTQQNESTTHRGGNTLDVMFTNNANMVHCIESFPSNVSDHYVVNTSTVYNASKSPKDEEEDPRENELTHSFNSLNFFDESVDWNTLNSDLEAYPWSREFRRGSPSEMMDRFRSVCLDICSDTVPEKVRSNTSPGSSKKKNKQRRSLLKRRANLRKRYSAAKLQTTRDAIMNKLASIEGKLHDSHKHNRQQGESRAVEKIKLNPKYFYSYAKSYSKVHVGVGPLMNSSKELISGPRKMAEILSEQYSSVFSTPRHDKIPANTLFPEDPGYEPYPSLQTVSFSDFDLMEAMEELSPNAAPGPDGFPAILLKKCKESLAQPLALIWRKSLKSGEIPESCKTATITPIHKGKSRATAKNYRPIALTSHLIKVFEKVLRTRIVKFMEKHLLFNNSQHGFRGGRSCLSQLLIHFDRITAALEKGQGVDVIYLDFAKAFDKVDHIITLNKLKSLGIHGALGRWIYNFLTNRTQSVIVEGRKSTPRPVISGVPQGSVLGPLLFLILMGDIDQNIVTAFLSSFADDTRVGNCIISLADTLQLQNDLQAVYQWSKDNNMEFHCDKFELMRYKTTASKEAQNQSTYQSFDGSVIDEVQHVRDLGVTLSNDATFKQHIHERCELVKDKISWVLRTFRCRDRLPMLTLWKSLILSHVEYCSQLWSPSSVGHTQSLELLQKSFVSRIYGMEELSYWEQLKTLNLYSLERRRERYQVIYTWKIMEGHVPNFDSTPIVVIENSRRGRSCLPPPLLSSAPERLKNIRFASLPHKGPRLFNSLPLDVRNLTGVTVDEFKSALDRHFKDIPDQPLIPNYTQYRQCDSNSIIDWNRKLQYDRRNSGAVTPLRRHGQPGPVTGGHT